MSQPSQRTALPPDSVVDAVVRPIVEALDPEKVILFGSHAAGAATSNSDIDLLIVMPEGTDRYQAAGDAYAAVRDVTVPIDIVVRTQAELNAWAEVPMSFAATVVREGRTLYESASTP